MAKLPTAEESLHKVLDVFGHFGTRPGEVVRVGNLRIIAAQRRWRMQDIAQGLEKSVELGLVGSTYRLTAAGSERV